MEHWRIVKQNFSNLKKKKLSRFREFWSALYVAILFKICYPRKTYVEEIFLKLVI